MQKGFSFFFILFFLSSLQAQDIPAGGESVLSEDAAVKMSITGGNRAKRTVVDVEDMPFDRAVQGETLSECEQTWDAQFIIKGEYHSSVTVVFHAKGI